MPKYEYLPHPADLKIWTVGKNQKELFINAASGMLAFLYPDCPKACRLAKKPAKINLKANDIKALMVDWLSEILYLSDTKNICFNKFNFKKITAEEIQAEIFGCPAKAQNDIKAVTYHGLEIKKTKTGWQAVILFDI